jgi:hypothetical protein
MIADGIYYGTSAISGSPTIGDEYADLLPFSGKEFPPPLWRRFLFLISYSFGGFGIVLLLRSIKKLHYKKYFDDSLIPLIHNALFYFDSCYYYIAYRIAGIRFKLMRQIRKGERDSGYAILGILSIIQLLVKIAIKPVTTSISEEEE